MGSAGRVSTRGGDRDEWSRVFYMTPGVLRSNRDSRLVTRDCVFLFDVDNTLLDNDRVIADLRHYLVQAIGTGSADHYFSIFEQLRTELGYADYLGALQR